MIGFIQKIKNIIFCKRHSFAILNYSKNNTILKPGERLQISGTIKNNGLRNGTVYLIILLADPYNHKNIIYNTDKTFDEGKKQSLRYVDIKPSATRSFSCDIILPGNLKRGVLDISLELWTPDKLFSEALALHAAYIFYKTKWRGMIEIINIDKPVIKIFISYSWFSDEHRDWVRQLSEELRRHHIEPVLDQKNIYPGDDIISFMNESVSSQAVCLIICSASYTEKVNAKEGYVWYEADLLTKRQLSAGKNFTIIPIIRDNEAKTVPDCFGKIMHIDMDKEEWQSTPLSLLIAAITRTNYSA